MCHTRTANNKNYKVKPNAAPNWPIFICMPSRSRNSSNKEAKGKGTGKGTPEGGRRKISSLALTSMNNFDRQRAGALPAVAVAVAQWQGKVRWWRRMPNCRRHVSGALLK